MIALRSARLDLHLEGADFNEYLRGDGIPDILAAWGHNNECGRAARER